MKLNNVIDHGKHTFSVFLIWITVSRVLCVFEVCRYIWLRIGRKLAALGNGTSECIQC